VWLGTWKLKCVNYNLGFFALKVIGGARWEPTPFLKIGSTSQPDPNGLGIFQPEPTKIGTKTAQIRAGWVGSLPTPT
jgi:hypothetical protein